MKLNFNEWFYKYHEYLKNSNNYEYFNDTKWKNVNDRLMKLIELESDMLSEQPFNIISNEYGFDKLIELFDKSNYTFNDLNESLIDAYRMSYENAMSRMIVNTHAVISHCNSNDRKHVSIDRINSKYYIVDVPYNQLHFGDRDEVIRNYLDRMYNKRNERYISMDEMISDNILKVMNCAFICTTNGLICNDWSVAIDDKGFHFRIGWGKGYDVEFIIYKLDKCFVDKFEASIDTIKNGFINKNHFHHFDVFPTGVNCMIDIYNPLRDYTSTCPANFGVVKDYGLNINGLQQKTIDDLENSPYTTCTVIVYGLKYLFELPNTYPCVNYMDMLYAHPIKTEDDLDVYTYTENKVVGLSYDVDNTIPMCTPPISIDRSASTSYSDLISFVKLKSWLMTLEPTLLMIGNNINSSDNTTYYLNQNIYTPANNALVDLKNMYKIYMTGGIITSLVSYTYKNMFQSLIDRLELFINKIVEIPDIETAKRYAIGEFYGSEYSNFVERIMKPVNHPALKIFDMLDTTEFTKNYFDPIDMDIRFNRPISEQCFISVKYSYDEKCWVFCYPDIKHFHGIGNTFYINNGLTGNEVFKFLFLYTDTESVDNTYIGRFEYEDVFDFDKFTSEVEKYKGYIRYWNVENHLRKISRIMFSDDSSHDQLQVLSKILIGKLNGEELLDLYPTDMNYEPSNASSDNISLYTEDSERAPFALNFLFYTIMLMYNNKDQLLSYFLNTLTKHKFTNRYSDINISSILSEEYNLPVNYSIISRWNGNYETHLLNNKPSVFFGIPKVLNTNINDVYDYVFNRYDPETRYPYITENDTILPEVYIDNADTLYEFNTSYDVTLLNKMISYVGYCKDMMNFIETRYTYSFDICNQIYVYLKKYEVYRLDVTNFINSNVDKFIYTTEWLTYFVDSINGVIDMLTQLYGAITGLRNIIKPNQTMYDYINITFLPNLHKIYESYGFESHATKRIQSLYYHMTKINNPMNLFEFEKWVDEIDLDCLKYISDVMSNNPNNDPKPTQMFSDFYTTFDTFVFNVHGFASSIREIYEYISTDAYSTYIQTVTSTCFNSIYNSLNIDLYAIDECVINSNTSYNVKPRYISATISFTNFSGNTETKPIILIPITEKIDGKYKVIDIRQHCSYAFISYGTNITPSSADAYDSEGNLITPDNQLSFDIKLLNVGNALDKSNDTTEVCDILTTEFPFKNIHEQFDLVNDSISNKPYSNLNFELLSGNKFYPLTSTHEYAFTRNSLTAEPIDVLHISNASINKLCKLDYGYHDKSKVYVKPVQVCHNEIVNDELISTGQGYYKHHKIYVKTTDSNQFVFPIIIKSIDHSTYQGFIEAIVDYSNAKWFNIDNSEITSYVLNPVECEVLDDNVCNFLDEFNNLDYTNYQVIPFQNNIHEDIYSLPGDPIYVQQNSDYVHTRLSWIFGNDIPNRFIDQDHKFYHYTYINSGAINKNDSMRIFLLNHDFNTLTLPEMYPVLREEPNDHSVYSNEISTFKKLLNEQNILLKERMNMRNIHVDEYEAATDADEKFKYKLMIEDDDLKIDYTKSFIERLTDYIKQPENPTTWYNLYAYDDAITYINNGRAHMSHIPRVKDIIYTNKINVMMYDWEHKHWLNPNDFNVSVTTIESALDNRDDYKTSDVQYSLTITPIDPTFESKQILVYFVYDKSDMYDDINNDNKTVFVKFKPVLSTYKSNVDSIYTDIRIRKHYDSNEVYTVSEYYSDDNFSLTNGLYVKRINRSGKYPDASICRWDDIKVNNLNYSDFDIYVRFPFNHILKDQYTKTITYSVNINIPIDGFTKNETITLICISSNKFTGNVSDILFTAKTTNSSLNIINSSIYPIPAGEYICTVAKDPMYKSCGGVITITASTTDDENIIDDNHTWIHVKNPQYKIIPDEFILVSKGSNIVLPVNIELRNIYERDESYSLTPKVYYYDDEYHVRYPISNITNNDYTSRFVIDTTQNPNVKQIKSNYINVCRYSLQSIPKNGLLDFTGYIPTPLSRDRYEFWVNGRCLTDTNLSIISPTAIQLHNLTSLHNFELIELVDDIDNSNSVFPIGSTYMDLEGNTFSSYTLMMLSNKHIRYQKNQYRFYFNTKSPLDTYTGGIIDNPNNKDIEPDILSYLSITPSIVSYNQLYNIPTINGVPIYHLTTSDLGLLEIPANKILEVYDKVWAKEITTNPLFPITHRDLIDTTEYVTLHVFTTSDGFRITSTGMCNGFFTVYITSNPSHSIENATDTKKIIPMIKVGTSILVDNSYRGYWACTTFKKSNYIQLK